MQIKTKDPVLWNRLGATLANAGEKEMFFFFKYFNE